MTVSVVHCASFVYLQEVIAPTAPKRHKLSVHVVSSANHLPQQDTENNKEETTSPIQEVKQLKCIIPLKTAVIQRTVCVHTR